MSVKIWFVATFLTTKIPYTFQSIIKLHITNKEGNMTNRYNVSK